MFFGSCLSVRLSSLLLVPSAPVTLILRMSAHVFGLKIGSLPVCAFVIVAASICLCVCLLRVCPQN